MHYELPTSPQSRQLRSLGDKQDEGGFKPRNLGHRDLFIEERIDSRVESEPLYYTVTTNPLEDYSSGYHGSSSVYTNSSTSSGGSTLPPRPPQDNGSPQYQTQAIPPLCSSPQFQNLPLGGSTQFQNSPLGGSSQFQNSPLGGSPQFKGGSTQFQNSPLGGCTQFQNLPQGGSSRLGTLPTTTQFLPNHLPPSLSKGQASYRTMLDRKKDRFPDVLPFNNKGQSYLV